MNVDVLGTASSVATLILFVIYFIGRAITIHQERGLYLDELAIGRASQTDHDRYKVIETLKLVDNPYNVFYIISKQGIWNLKVYKYTFDNDINIVGEHKIKEYKFINIDEAIKIELNVPEIIPQYRVEYTTVDYKKVKFELRDNMKNGVMSQIAEIQHTPMSIIYYFFR